MEMQKFAGGLAGIVRRRSLRSSHRTALDPRTRALMQINAPACWLPILSR
jgi:hypothetical protein